MKTAEQIANEIYDREESWAWALGRGRLVPMMVEAIEVERAQRRELALWVSGFGDGGPVSSSTDEGRK